MILIVTQPGDPHADEIAAKLRARGDRFVRFDPAQFPAEAAVALSYGGDTPSGATLRLGGEQIDLEALTSIWYRRPRRPVADPAIADGPTRAWIEEESETFVRDLWERLDCRWVPARRSTMRRAQLKSAQLRVAARLGFELPPTLITNDPDAVLDFYRAQGGRIVSKPVGFTQVPAIEKRGARYTELVSTRDVGYVDAVRFCPMIFQAYVPKRVELRITVVGRQVFAAEIHSQESNHTRHDWRRYDGATTRYAPHALPADLAARCLALVEGYGLTFGAIDLILTPDGRYVFLELNPNGQFLWIEHATGLPISDALCDLLAAAVEPAGPTPALAPLPAGAW